MKETVSIVKSVGRYGANRAADVTTIQKRLNRWIAFGRLPGLDLLAVDGKCGSKTKTAIGAFQLRYVMGVTQPDCRCDPGGASVTHLGLDFSEGPKQTPGDPVYDGWLHTQIDHSDSAPYWEKRNSVWFGVGLKGSAGTPLGGTDLSIATLYNDFDANNSFQVAVTTERRANLGAGYSGGLVLCVATGIYHPNDLHHITSEGWDFNLALGAKWKSLAKAVTHIPNLGKLASVLKVANYADASTVSQVVTSLKAYAALEGFEWGKTLGGPMPSFTAIDTPLGGGTEISLFYGVSSYTVLHKHLL